MAPAFALGQLDRPGRGRGRRGRGLVEAGGQEAAHHHDLGRRRRGLPVRVGLDRHPLLLQWTGRDHHVHPGAHFGGAGSGVPALPARVLPVHGGPCGVHVHCVGPGRGGGLRHLEGARPGGYRGGRGGARGGGLPGPQGPGGGGKAPQGPGVLRGVRLPHPLRRAGRGLCGRSCGAGGPGCGLLPHVGAGHCPLCRAGVLHHEDDVRN